MSHRRGYSSSNGVIRPRQFNTNYSKHDKDNSVFLKALMKKTLFFLFLIFPTVYVLYTFSTTESGKETSYLRSKEEGSRLNSARNPEVHPSTQMGDDDDDLADDDMDDAQDEDVESDDTEDKDDAMSDDPDDHSDLKEGIYVQTDEVDETVNSQVDLKSAVPTKLDEKMLKVSLNSFFHNMGMRPVHMETSGSFKYILAEAKDFEGSTELFVQGCLHSQGKKCKHPDAFRYLKDTLSTYQISAKILGGGRITFHGLKKVKSKIGVISVFGYSKTFGACEDCNRKACEVIFRQYPEYVVRYSNQGYSEKDEYKIKDFIKCST